MLITPQVILSEPTALGVDLRLREFAHRLAKTHEIETAKISRPEETTLLEYLESWEMALRSAGGKHFPFGFSSISIIRPKRGFLVLDYPIEGQFGYMWK